MSSGFSGGGPDFPGAGGFTGRSLSIDNPQNLFRSQLSGVITAPVTEILHRRPDLIGKRSLAEFQAQQQQQQALELYLRNVKHRTYQQASPISPLSPVDSSTSSVSSSPAIYTRYGFPIFQQPRPGNLDFSGAPYPNLFQNRVVKQERGLESEEKMMSQLQELEKQLLNEDEDEEGDNVSTICNSEWSETIQTLINQPISPSPDSSSSSCSSTPTIICSKQAITEVASAISDGKTDVAIEILSRLNQFANVGGTSEQRITAYMAAALRRRVKTAEQPPPPIGELYSKEHVVSTQMLHDVSPCFKLGFMAANLAILETTSDQRLNKLHIVDFDIGHGGQYNHLIYALAAARKSENPMFLKITTFTDFENGSEERLKMIGDGLKLLSNKAGICLNFNVLGSNFTDLSIERLGVERDEVLAVNLAFRLHKLPDESVTTENLRDELLRRVKGLSPAVVTVIEQEMNANTAPFAARVMETREYYGALFDSLEATVPKDHPGRAKIEEGLGRVMGNVVACEGRDRVERCEVFGKWRARMCMAGLNPKPVGPHIAESLRTRLKSGTRGNPGFMVKEENGGIRLGWMDRTLTVTSAWH